MSTSGCTKAEELKAIGVGFIAISSNDVKISPEDSSKKMKEFAQKHNFNLPYVIDAFQKAAKECGAVCTPDFFGFNSDLKLQYRGRLDSAKAGNIPDAKRELFIAMSEIAKTGKFAGEQTPSLGCSIKWRK